MRVVLHLKYLTNAALLFIGVAMFLASFYYDSTLFALIGLGLAFWGVLFFYVGSEEYTRKAPVEATLPIALATLGRVVQELDYRGDAVCLPPRYFEQPEATRLYVPKSEGAHLPPAGQVLSTENTLFSRTPQALLIMPPGIRLSELIEDTLGTGFMKVDLEYIQKNLPGVLVEDMKVARDLTIEIDRNQERRGNSDAGSLDQPKTIMVKVRITKSVYGNLFKEVEKGSPLDGSICCPICSAIGVALTKASNNPVKIVKVSSSENERITEAVYEILEA